MGWLIAIFLYILFFLLCLLATVATLKKKHWYEVRQVQRLTPTTPLPSLELRN
jgi:hypothetical protein